MDLKTGTPRRGLKARFIIPNYSGAGAGGTWTPTIDGSSDNTTFQNVASGTPLTIGTAAAVAEQWVPFETTLRYVRANMLNGVTTSTPTITYQADLGTARP